MAQVLIVVARELPHLYDRLTRTFSGMPDIEVILDRRRAAKHDDQARESEGNRLDRRCQPGLEEDLRSPGFALVRPQQEPYAG
ncbi:MAG: hypothetical protein HY725_02735 [Candidatus Rokubacteria bacterium]|nr:hypothetical protein [Candidatus Rokubacteria bacterium]